MHTFVMELDLHHELRLETTERIDVLPVARVLES